jgi:GNAT superfamily N-acetyltransferase
VDAPSAGEVVVAPYAAAFWHDLWEIQAHHLAEHGVILGPDDIPRQPQVVEPGAHEWDYHQIDRVYLSGRGGFWLAWFDGTPVGHVGAQDLGEGIELRRMYVRREFRRRGIGTLLVRELVGHCGCQGVSAIELWTAERGPGRALYETIGFRATAGPGFEFGNVGTLTRFEPGSDEVRMRLDLIARATGLRSGGIRAPRGGGRGSAEGT